MKDPIEEKLRRTFTYMKNRCENKNSDGHQYYGPKGIVVCWKNWGEFAQDMRTALIEHVKIHGMRNTTIDRIDSDKSYCVENCQWATVQVQNRKNLIKLTVNGETKSLLDWASATNIPISILYARKQKGLPAEKMLTVPRKRKEYKRSVYRISERHL